MTEKQSMKNLLVIKKNFSCMQIIGCSFSPIINLFFYIHCVWARWPGCQNIFMFTEIACTNIQRLLVRSLNMRYHTFQQCIMTPEDFPLNPNSFRGQTLQECLGTGNNAGRSPNGSEAKQSIISRWSTLIKNADKRWLHIPRNDRIMFIILNKLIIFVQYNRHYKNDDTFTQNRTNSVYPGRKH